jgi:hypothetical protein
MAVPEWGVTSDTLTLEDGSAPFAARAVREQLMRVGTAYRPVIVCRHIVCGPVSYGRDECPRCKRFLFNRLGNVCDV